MTYGKSNTALTHIHESLGAKMVSFAGYNMPVQYQGVNIEHINVRENVGVFDVSHMGRIYFVVMVHLIWSKKLHLMMFRNLLMERFSIRVSPMEKGDCRDLLVYKMNNDCYLLVVNASNIKKIGLDFDAIIRMM